MIVALLTALVLTACSAPGGREITVSAAASLTFAFEEIAPLYEAETGVHPVLNFASSGHLAHQIAAGAPVDVFASANVAYIDELRGQGLVDTASARTFCRGRLVVWTRRDEPAPVRNLADLAEARVGRFAMANPEHAPYGAAARQALQQLNLWTALQPKLVLGETVRQALHYGERGDVAAALVSLSVAADSDGQWREVPDSLHAPIEHAVAAVAGRPKLAAARRFVAFLDSPAGRHAIERHGFIVPGAAQRGAAEPGITP